ncbi:MAG TPA: hypothetical protein VFX51_16090 [Solirubrobacteraceae bacterium]|nr:hypothetical protein [Solirubrobacteraceae bacterium]
MNVVSADEVIAYGLTLPRSTEGVVRGMRKLYIGRIVYVAIEREDIMGFGHPKEWREALIETDPEKFLMPLSRGDLRWNWACVRMDKIDSAEMRELVLDAWAMCVPKKVLEAYKAGQAA